MTKSDAALEYEQRLTRVARRVLTKALAAVDFTPLAKDLGCRYVVESEGAAHAFHVAGPLLHNAECEPKVRRTLLKAMHWQLARPIWHDSRGSSILSGLVQQERWRDCLKTEDGAYALAGMLLHWAMATKVALPAECVALRRAIAGDINVLLNTWLPQAAPWKGAPSPERLLRCMFGDAWFELIAGDTGIKAGLLNLIASSRPAFLPGLLPVQEARSTLSLPLPALA